MICISRWVSTLANIDKRVCCQRAFLPSGPSPPLALFLSFPLSLPRSLALRLFIHHRERGGREEKERNLYRVIGIYYYE